MYQQPYICRISLVIITVAFCQIGVFQKGFCQARTLYPPFTKWYQDPLGLRPLELSTAVGFAWGAAVTGACLIFSKKDSSFQKKTAVIVETGFTNSYKPPYTNSVQSDIGLIFDSRKWMSLGIGLNSFHFKDGINDTYTFGLMPFARWYAYKKKAVSIFFQYSAGISYSLNIFPLTGTELEQDTGRIGTQFNFLSKYSAGAEFRLTKKLSLQASVKHFHLSNGNIKGINRNPSHDSNGFFLGLIYQLLK